MDHINHKNFIASIFRSSCNIVGKSKIDDHHCVEFDNTLKMFTIRYDGDIRTIGNTQDYIKTAF